MAESTLEEIIEHLREHADEYHLERPRGSLKIDWGDESISFQPSWVDRVPRRVKRRAVRRLAG
jgi:hypothetical protein